MCFEYDGVCLKCPGAKPSDTGTSDRETVTEPPVTVKPTTVKPAFKCGKKCQKKRCNKGDASYCKECKNKMPETKCLKKGNAKKCKGKWGKKQCAVTCRTFYRTTPKGEKCAIDGKL